MGSIQLIRDVLPYLRAQGGGRIVQLSSEGGQIASGDFAIKGDARRTVDAMIAAAYAANLSLRLALGSTAYTSISQALTVRRNLLEAQKEVALSVDRDG